MDEVIALLGEPAAREGRTELFAPTWFFVGPGGLGKVRFFEDGTVKKAVWKDGTKKESDLFTQFLMAICTGAVGLAMILQFLRVLLTRVALTDAGLKVNSQGGRRWGGSPLVPIDAMTGLGTEDYKKKGWVEVQYRLADGIEGTVSLNDYVHRAFPEIIAEICDRRGFESPIKPPQEAEEHGDQTEEAGGERTSDSPVDGDGQEAADQGES